MTRKPTKSPEAGLLYTGALTAIDIYPLDKDGNRQRDRKPDELVLVPGRVYADLPEKHPVIAALVAKEHLVPHGPAATADTAPNPAEKG